VVWQNTATSLCTKFQHLCNAVLRQATKRYPKIHHIKLQTSTFANNVPKNIKKSENFLNPGFINFDS